MVKMAKSKNLPQIEFVEGDILSTKLDILVNPVNCCGVMGAGLAAKIKEMYPEVYSSYLTHKSIGDLTTGNTIIVVAESDKNARYIANLPTKDDYRKSSKIEFVSSGMESLVSKVSNIYKTNNIRVIGVPALGCGLGGLNWEDVKDVIVEKALASPSEIKWLIFRPLTK